jgi:glycosyltransferase involved in cell wall biosynthesis
MFSIIIPTWNNLEMLKLCVEAIRQHSVYEHEIILHINEGADGTEKWANTEGVIFTKSSENIGICKAMNLAFGKATKNYILYLNDDMYVLPDWDKYLVEEVKTLGNQLFMLSSTLIEPTTVDYPCMIHGDYGRDVENFQKEKLLAEYKSFEIKDWYGSSWPPLVISRKAWLLIGGFSIEFSPGMYSDPDLSMKMWHAGCRIFKGLGKSRVYHFQSRSTGRIKKNDGRTQFMKKWGIPASAFYKYYLKMGEPYEGFLGENREGGIFLRLEKIKARFYALIKSSF